jgi:DNA-binding transcriptional MerR regulator
MSDPVPLSIGEVLSVLQEEFPDVTISKIRFLESQGLVRPERNASGYRQFTDTDVERLTWILRQQRDHFLPLKVIKKALERGVDVHDAGEADQPTLWSAYVDAAAQDAAEEAVRLEDSPEESAADRSTLWNQARTPGGDRLDAGAAALPEGESASSRSSEVAEAPEPESPRRRHHTPADVVAALQEDPRHPEHPPAAPRTDPRRPRSDPSLAAAGVGVAAAAGEDGPLTREELLATAGIDDVLLAGLESYGLVEPVPHAGEAGYSPCDVEVARAAGVLAAHGVEPRHLRIYKVAAEREAGFVEQLVTPLLKQRNPAARARARELATELADLGAQVHAAILSRELGADVAS